MLKALENMFVLSYACSAILR